MTMNNCVLQPALVTEDLRRAAEKKTEELFVALVAAKNEWQYAATDQDAKYERVLRLKAEYTEWRAMTERLSEILAGETPPPAGLPSARSGEGFAMRPSFDRRRRTGTGR